MRRKALVLGLLGLSAGLVVVSACVGDDPAGPDGTGTTGNDAGGVGVNTVDSGNGGTQNEGGGEPTDSGAETSAPNACAAAVTGAYIDAGALGFYGSHNGVAATSNGWVFAGGAQNHAQITYNANAPPIGDASDPTEGASVARLDAQGNVIWQQIFGGSGTDQFSAVTVDESDNVYLAGWFSSPSITFGTITLTSPVQFATQGMVVKLDAATGNPLWARMFVSGSFGFGCNAIDYANGRLVTACSMGQTQAYTGPGNSALTLTSGQVTASSVYSLDPAKGEAVWADSFSTAAGTDTNFQTTVQSVDVTDTTVVVAGTFNGTSHMVDKTAVDVAPTGALYTGFVTELTADTGLYHFAAPFGGTTDAGTIYQMVAAGTSADGGIYVGGNFAGTVTFAQPHTSIASSNDAYAFLLDNKASPPAWEKILGGTQDEAITSILIDNCGHPEVMLSAGSSLGTIDGVKMPPAGNGPAMIVAKLSTTGTMLWASGTANGGNADTNGINPEAFGLDKNGHTRIVGNFRGQIDFGSGAVTVGPKASTPFFVEYAP